jgi:hypothetical protein
MKIHEYNEMMAWLKKPKRLFSSRKDTIGGGAIQGEDLGSRMGFAGPRLIKQGPDKGKYIVRYRNPKFGKREGQKGYNEGNTEPMTKKEADAFYQDLQSKVSEKKAAGLKSKNVAVEKQAKQINDFVNTFVDKNITNFDVRDYVNFRKDLLKEFNKTKIGYASGRNALYKGLPNVGIEEAENYFKKLFYTNKINSDPTFQKRIGDYLEYYNIDKKFYGGSELDKEAKILARKQYADVLDNAGDVLFVLGDDKVGTGKFRSSIVKQFFPEEMEIYNRKKQASGAAYEEKLAQIEERLGPKKLKQVLNGETSIKRFMTKQSDILKDIFDLSTLDEGLRFNLDHAEGIAEIAKMENSNDIMRALNNLIGMTQSRNYELGWRGYSTSRKNLLNKIEQGIDVDKSLKQLNDLTKSVYPETQGKDAYKIIKGKVTPTKNFQFMYEPEKAFGQYFMEIGGTEKGTEQIIRQAAENPQLEKFITEIEGGNFENFPKVVEKYRNNKINFGKTLNYYCGIAGRARAATGLVPGATCSADDIVQGMKIDAKTAAGKTRLTNVAKNFGKVFGKIVAPIDIGIEGAFAMPHLLRGDIEGAIGATTAGLFGAGKDAMEQVGEKFGTDSIEYALYGREQALQKKITAMGELDKLFSQSEQLGLIPSEEGVMQKEIGREPQQKALQKQFANQFKTLAKLDTEATQDFEKYYPATSNFETSNKALQNIRSFSDEIQQAGILKPSDPTTLKGFLETGGGKSQYPLLTRFDIPALQAQATDYTGMDYLDRISEMPTGVAAQVPAFEKEQVGKGIKEYAMKYGPRAAKEFYEAQGIDTQPYLSGMSPILYMKMGGRIQLADGGRLSFAEGPEDPKKRATLKKIGVGGGLTAAVATGLVNLLDLFKGGAKKGVVATKAAQSQAEKLFFDLVNAVKNKGIIDKLDRASDFSRGGAYYEYKGVKVLEDGENIELQFTTDKGAPAVVEYRKPSYDVDPEAGTSYKVPGEFTNEGQEIGRFGKDGDVDIDFENEIIDPIENVKKIIDD